MLSVANARFPQGSVSWVLIGGGKRGNYQLNHVIVFSQFWSTVKSSSEQSNEDTNTCFRLRDEVTEIKEMLRKLASEIGGIDEDMQSYFDGTFYAEAAYTGQWYIECYSDSSADKIRFSRALDTGAGRSLPTNATLNTYDKSTRMFLDGVRERHRFGAYRCGLEAEDGSADTVVPYQSGYLYFTAASEVASVGDSVKLRLSSLYSDRVLWSRDGRRVPAWNGRTEVFIGKVKKKDAGIYSVRYESESEDVAVLHLYVRRCKANMYDERCDKVCPPCYNGGICHDLLGTCVCPEGFVGSNCETPCPEGFRGADCSTACGDGKCKYRLFCKQHPFGCACARGFEGATCWKSCDLGWYGASCKQLCHCADGPESCNRFTGECWGRCAPGWKGLSCQIREYV